ncbi:AI-2E family transporter [Velocimicrobium porci]|mgnify:CR=1 FL=1|uniref:AI-2E family transporter n=1 Tax=Velocimicrobium porci TaxID=2606634 RepID=UPI0012B35B97|nr:AI-2E family transporter [Velocimicrobium porci]
MNRSEYKQLLFLIGTIGAVYLSFRYILPLVVPFIFSYFLAKLVYPVAAKLKKNFHISGGVSGSLLIGGITGIVGLVFFVLIQQLFYQTKDMIKNMPRYQQIILTEVDGLCDRCDTMFGLKSGSSNGFIYSHISKGVEQIKTGFGSFFSTETIQGIAKVFGACWILFLILLGAYFIIKDMDDLKIIFEESIFYQFGKPLLGKLGQVGAAYGKAQLFIMGADAFVCMLGFFLMGKRNSFLIGLGISVFDAFPALGCGLILIPWCVLSLLRGNWYQAAVLFTLYVLCQIIREVIEAKTIGKGTGIKPIFSLISMYVGVKLFGILGFILGPIAYIIIKSCVESQSV